MCLCYAVFKGTRDQKIGAWQGGTEKEERREIRQGAHLIEKIGQDVRPCMCIVGGSEKFDREPRREMNHQLER